MGRRNAVEHGFGAVPVAGAGGGQQLLVVPPEILEQEQRRGGGQVDAETHVSPPMPGQVIKILVEVGDTVEAGQSVALRDPEGFR